MAIIRFVFIGEGVSDAGLVPHLENLCIELGAEEVTGVAVDFERLGEHVGHTVAAKLRAARRLEPNANLFFIHRDADSRDPQPRHEEIAAAITACALSKPCVAVVPVQETEAWLLLDELRIRTVAGRPSGRISLNLPRPSHVEDIANPKERLKAALVLAANLTGRRLARFNADFPTHRLLLLQRLPTGGALLDLPSWKRMRDDLAAAIKQIDP